MNIDFSKTALIVIDIQNDFCPNGALAVSEGDKIIQGVNRMSALFDTVVLSQDWHPKKHASFATTHEREAFSSIELAYGDQTLWPDHCVQGSMGAEFHKDLKPTVERAQLIVRKGNNIGIDSYSAFFENDKTTTTGLAGYLRDKGIEQVVLVGLAYDFCVAYSAIDARTLGFEVIVVKDLTRAIGMPLGEGKTTVDQAEQAFAEKGVVVGMERDVFFAYQASQEEKLKNPLPKM